MHTDRPNGPDARPLCVRGGRALQAEVGDLLKGGAVDAAGGLDGDAVSDGEQVAGQEFGGCAGWQVSVIEGALEPVLQE